MPWLGHSAMADGSFMFLIGMSGPQGGPDVSESEFTAVLDSVEIIE
jgi:hypothetical protein